MQKGLVSVDTSPCRLIAWKIIRNRTKNSRSLNLSWRRDLNPRPSDYKSDALPTELRQHTPTEQKYHKGNSSARRSWERNKWWARPDAKAVFLQRFAHFLYVRHWRLWVRCGRLLGGFRGSEGGIWDIDAVFDRGQVHHVAGASGGLVDGHGQLQSVDFDVVLEHALDRVNTVGAGAIGHHAEKQCRLGVKGHFFRTGLRRGNFDHLN